MISILKLIYKANLL